jgi:hypothetical protein
MYKQNRNIDGDGKPKKKPKRGFGAEKYTN